jgi:hypothetical protein
MSYRLLEFGGVMLPTARIAGTFGTGPSVDATVRTIGGMWDASGNADADVALPYEQTYSAWLMDTAATTQTQLEDLQALRGQRHILYRIDEVTDQLTWCWARCLQVRTPWQIQRKTMQPVDVIFQLQTPWYGWLHGDDWFLDSSETLAAACDLEELTTFTLDASPIFCYLQNTGHAITRLGAITVTCNDAAPITHVMIYEPPFAIEWNGTLENGHLLQINGRTMSVVNDSEDAYSGFAFSSYASSAAWFQLAPGGNEVYVEFTGGGTTSTITFDYCDGEN